MTTFYISAWILLGLAAVSLFSTGNFDPVTAVTLSLLAIGLVFALALWPVVTNAYDVGLKIFDSSDEA